MRRGLQSRGGTGRRGRPTLLLHDRHEPSRLVARPCRLVDRLLARACASGLDQRLAAGEAPESSRLLATRAEVLVSSACRRELARDWEHALALVRRAPSPRAPRLAARPELTDTEPEARAMLYRLSAQAPVAARGVATARLLLTDASGPLYNRRHPTALPDVLRAVSAQLDPSRSLLAG